MDNSTEKMSTSLRSWPFWVVPVCLSVIVVFGFLIRIEDMRAWHENPDRAFYDNEPLLTNLDGYYYLRIARDLAENNYRKVDTLRVTPDHPNRPIIPPLLSVIASVVHNITNLSFNWIGVFLPPILGVLLVFPLYGIGRFYSGPLMGLIAAVTGVISNMYYIRTSIGWFDTDCMNITLSFSVAYFFLRFGLEESRRRYIFFLAGIVTWMVFLWWWDMAKSAVVIISMIPLGVALLFYYRPARRERDCFIVIIALVLTIFFVWQGVEVFKLLYLGAQNLLHYVIGVEGELFPNVGQIVGEQSNSTLIQVVSRVADSYPVLLLGITGMLWFICRHPKKSLFLLAPVSLSFFGIFGANRFLIFLGPVFGIGIGFLISELWEMRLRFSVFRLATPALIVMIIIINTTSNIATTQWAKYDPGLVEGFQYVEKNAPSDTVIWAWWDWGHPMIYWSKRAAITDGAAHGGELSVYNAIPFATSSPRLAANFIKFYVIHGLAGVSKFYEAVGDDPARGLDLLKEVLAAGPSRAKEILLKAHMISVGGSLTINDWLEFLFPPPGRAIYFSLDYRLGQVSHWWYWLGTWDIATHHGEHSKYISFTNVNTDKNGASDHRTIFADFNKGDILLLRYRKLLKSVTLFDEMGEQKQIVYEHDAMAYLEIFTPQKYAVLQRKDISESLYNRLFLRHEVSEYFRPVRLKTPIYQLYEVVGDVVRQL